MRITYRSIDCKGALGSHSVHMREMTAQLARVQILSSGIQLLYEDQIKMEPARRR